MKNKVFFLIFAVCFVVLMLGVVGVSAETYGNYKYSVANGEVTVTGLITENFDDVIIPNEIGGYPVTAIGNHAFDNCDSLKSLTIPASVTSIDIHAFDYCTELTSIIVDESNEQFSSYDGVLFNKDKTILVRYPIGRSDMTYIIPDSVKSIGEYAFRYCEYLKNVSIPDSVETIGDYAFFECLNLRSIATGNSVETIGRYAFGECPWLIDVVISDSVKTIGNYAFYMCYNLTNLTIGNSVTTLNDEMFMISRNVKNLSIGASVTTIEDGTLDEFEDLINITVSKNNKNFSSQDGVLFNKDKTVLIKYPERKSGTKYTVPDTVKTIESGAFSMDSDLIDVKIPKSVTVINQYAFACYDLKDVYYTGTEEQWNEILIDDFYRKWFERVTFHYNTKPDISIWVNGEKVSFDQAPILENDRTLVPLRAIFEALGASVEWDNDTQTVTSQKDDTKISLQIGSTKMYVNESEKILDVPAKLLNDRTLVPVRAISEAFGCNVDWEDETQTVIITD